MPTQFTYKEAGVDIQAGSQLVDHIKTIAKPTQRPEVLSGIGGFAALFEFNYKRYQQPVLVSSTDGVGTKLKIASAMQQHHTIGIDLVAMCVNDIIVQGAEPLFFLDYFATGKLSLNIAQEVISGISKGCELANVALIGGETAEMPDFYQSSDYDLAGFCVGVVDKPKIIDGSRVKSGDILIGIASSGPHSNGYSLIRKILQVTHTPLSMPFENTTLGDILLTPTRIYVNALQKLLKEIDVHAIAHITGGGITENLPRVMPSFTQAVIDKQSWKIPSIFEWIQKKGNIDEDEMLKTFNCGIGMIVCVAEEDANKSIHLLNECGEYAWKLGHVQTHTHQSPCVIYKS